MKEDRAEIDIIYYFCFVLFLYSNKFLQVASIEIINETYDYITLIICTTWPSTAGYRPSPRVATTAGPNLIQRYESRSPQSMLRLIRPFLRESHKLSRQSWRNTLPVIIKLNFFYARIVFPTADTSNADLTFVIMKCQNINVIIVVLSRNVIVLCLGTECIL